jgi:hypothetical protein
MMDTPTIQEVVAYLNSDVIDRIEAILPNPKLYPLNSELRIPRPKAEGILAGMGIADTDACYMFKVEIKNEHQLWVYSGIVE